MALLEIFNTYSGKILWIALISYLIAIAFSLSIHEYSHARVAYNCGDNTAYLCGRMTINPLKHLDPFGAIFFLLVGFGWAKPVPVNSLKFKEYRKGIFLTSVAGITANFIISFFSCGFLVLTQYLLDICSIEFWCYVILFFNFLFGFLTTINSSLCIFNLIPIYPLDGFNMIRSLTKGDNKFVNFMARYGNIILIVLFLTNIFEIGMSYVVSNILTPVISFWSKIIFGV